MTDSSVQRIAANYELLADRMPELAAAFYVRLFQVLPESRALFKIDIALQSQHLAAALAIIVRNMRLLHVLEEPLAELGEEVRGRLDTRVVVLVEDEQARAGRQERQARSASGMPFSRGIFAPRARR